MQGGSQGEVEGGGQDSAPTRARLHQPGPQAGKKGPISLAVHRSQDRLRGQSHEVSRYNQESRRARGEHWASHVSLGSKPQGRSLPAKPHSQEEWGPLSPTEGHRGTSSKALFICEAWTIDFLLPRTPWLTGPIVGVGVGRAGGWGWRVALKSPAV